MKIKKTFLFTTIILTLVILCFPHSFWSQNKNIKETSKSAGKFALLIGIKDYTGEIEKLDGAENDVGLMKELLAEYGFKETPANVSDKKHPCGNQTETSRLKTLCSRQATKRAIVDAIENHLIGNAKKYKEQTGVSSENGAHIVFYFSGHGSFLVDDGVDEADGFDETIVPADGEEDGTNQIRDDELNKYITELREYTANITFIFDSCNSGTATRGRGAKRIISKTKGVTERSPQGSRKNLEDGYDADNYYVTISGSLPNELSFEDYFPNPETEEITTYSALTYNFVTFVRQNPGTTYRDVMNLVRNAVVSLGRSQTPQAEGDIDRPVFGSSASKGKVPIFPECKKTGEIQICSEVEKREIDRKEVEIHKIKMNAGEIIGARKGGTIAVYSPKAKELSGDTDKIGTGIITSAQQFNSTAEVILSDDTVKTFPENAKIVIVSPNFTDEKRTVALDFSSNSSKGKQETMDAGAKVLEELLNNKLKDNPYVEPVKAFNLLKNFNAGNKQSQNNNQQWDVAVVRAAYKDYLVGNEKKNLTDETLKENDEVFFISDKNGMPLYNFFVKTDDKEAAERIKTVLERHVRLENLRMLSNQASSVADQIKVEFVRVKEFTVEKFASDGKPHLCKAEPYNDEKIKQDQISGTPKIKFAERTENSITGDGFYFRITNTSDKPLYVYIYSLDIKGEIELLIPLNVISEELMPGKTISTSQQNNCKVYFYTAKKSVAGKETFKFIVTSEPFPAELLTQPAINFKGVRNGNSPLAALLKQAATNQPRSIGSRGGSLGTWGTLSYDVEIIP